MPRFLDTRGRSIISLGICARCACKYPLEDLSPDPNAPGLLCCPDGCLDVLDPWRLPARAAEKLTVDQPRPDMALVPGATPVYVAPLQAVVRVAPGKVLVGAQVTPVAPYGQGEVGLDIFLFTCIVPGMSGPIAPLWPEFVGVPIQDGQVTWINAGAFLG